MLTARESALATIQHEHLSLELVLHTLREFLQRIESGVAAPEFDMFSAVLYYIDEFQERCHHPKEEAFIFQALSAVTPRFSATIEGLQAGHRYGAQAMAVLYRALVQFQGGAPNGLAAFRAAVDGYAHAMFEHMRIETALFEQAAHLLDENTWRNIATAFEGNDDPLFGKQPREEFARLFQRIQRLAPRKLRQSLAESAASR